LDVGLDPLVLVVVAGADVDGGLQVPETPFGLVERLVAFGDVGGREAFIGGAEQEFAVEVGFSADRGVVDAQFAGGRGSEEPVERGFGLQRTGEFRALTPG
jgi:hypothetical protein